MSVFPLSASFLLNFSHHIALGFNLAFVDLAIYTFDVSIGGSSSEPPSSDPPSVEGYLAL
jgi:hypothetical protein